MIKFFQVCAPDSAGGVVGCKALQVLCVRRVWLEGHCANLLQVSRLWSPKVPSTVSQEIFLSIISCSCMRLLFIEWEDGSKREEMGFVEFSDLKPAI